MSESNGNEVRDPRTLRAAALKYNSETDHAPIVVAAGGGYVASKIIELADECGISVYHDDSAATLLSRLSMGSSIPPEFYQMVVDIYSAVMAVADHKKEDI